MHVQKIEEDIIKTLELIYEISMPVTPNPFHSYNSVGKLDDKFLRSVMAIEGNPNLKMKAILEHQKKFTLQKAQSLKKREDILPFVHKSYELISKIFQRKKDKTIIPKFYLEKPEFPMFMEPGIIFDNFFISKNSNALIN